MAKDEDFSVIYSNLVRITHGGLEFLLDFKQLSPENKDLETAPTQVRIVLHPAIAKGLRDALADNVARYEQQFGEIPAPPKGATPPMH
jgi:hypothetical protein